MYSIYVNKKLFYVIIFYFLFFSLYSVYIQFIFSLYSVYIMYYFGKKICSFGTGLIIS
jgi:hypothetical protein